MGCDSLHLSSHHVAPHFNPRTRMGCDVALLFLPTPEKISIHAPAWGATGWKRSMGLRGTNFNPRTRMGCDKYARERNRNKTNFNPRTRMGCDQHARAICYRYMYFNPRTRMGCDKVSVNGRIASLLFQSTHPHGVRLPLTMISPSKRLFQSTHPHGVRRPTPIRRTTDDKHFNPRTRMGCDQELKKIADAIDISIHAPAWGATRQSRTISFQLIQLPFQSTHPRGVRQGEQFKIIDKKGISIHAPAWGATLHPLPPLRRLLISIHAPAWGATRGINVD